MGKMYKPHLKQKIHSFLKRLTDKNPQLSYIEFIRIVLNLNCIAALKLVKHHQEDCSRF